MSVSSLIRNGANFLSKTRLAARIFSTEASQAPALNKKKVEVTFIKASGERIKVHGKVGDSLLNVVVDNNLDLDGFGACEGTLTCSTCHLIFKQEDYDKIPNKQCDEEYDMLDLASEVTDTSRLGCQIVLTEDMNGLEVKVPSTILDIRS